MAMAMAMEIGVCSALYKVPLTHFGPVSGQAESQALTDTTHTHAKGSYPLACKVFCQPTNNVNGRQMKTRKFIINSQFIGFSLPGAFHPKKSNNKEQKIAFVIIYFGFLAFDRKFKYARN